MYDLSYIYIYYFLVATSNRQASNETALMYVCIAFQNIIVIHLDQMFEF